MLSAIVVLVGLSFLIVIHELGHFLSAKYFGIWVEEFGFGLPPRLWGKKIGETIYSLNWLPLGGFVRLHGELKDEGERSFVHQLPWKKAVVIVAGVAANFIAGWLIISAVYFIGAPTIVFIDSVSANSPAAQAGLNGGEIVLGWEISDLINFINNNKGKEISLRIKTNGTVKDINFIPRADYPEGDGPLGISLRRGGIEKQNLPSSFYHGFVASWAIIFAIVAGLYHIFLTPDSVVGPVGIFNVAINTGEVGLIYVLQLLGLISLNLALLNILPIPALDGGRLLFVIIEKIRKKRFSEKFEVRANSIGFAILLLLIILVTIKDINSLL